MQTERVEKADTSLVIIYYYFILLFLYYFKTVVHIFSALRLYRQNSKEKQEAPFANITKVFKQTIIHYILRSKIKEKEGNF